MVIVSGLEVWVFLFSLLNFTVLLELFTINIHYLSITKLYVAYNISHYC